MRRGTLFWGAVLILLGVFLLLENLGILSINLWQIFWPALLIVLGLWVLFGALLGRRGAEVEHANVPLEGAARARLRINHGAGRLRIQAGAGAGDLVEGDFGGGLDLKTRHDGDLLDARLSVPMQVFPFSFWNWGPGGLEWSVNVNQEIPIVLTINTGAGDAQIDLSSLQVPELRLQTGASSSSLILPANAGQTQVVVEAGAAAVRISIPSGVAARIRNQSGLSSLNIDTTRFSRLGSGLYESPDYATASNKVDVDVRTGVGSVDIR